MFSYVGLDSVERSSNNPNKRRRYGKISKQGDRMLRWLLVIRDDPRFQDLLRRMNLEP